MSFRSRRAHRRHKPVSSSAVRPSPGSMPGVLQTTPGAHPSRLYVIGYGPDGFEEKECKDISEIQSLRTKWPVVWVNMVGLENIALLEQLGEAFGLERLLLEDVLDISSRPKVEFYDHYIFTTIKGGILGEQVETEHLSLFLKQNLVLVFEEKPGRSFGQVRERLRRGTGRIRHMGADYLFYALLDEVIDRYFPLLDHLNHQLSVIEDEIVSRRPNSRDRDVIEQIHNAKTDLLLLHRVMLPVGDLVNALLREDTELIGKQVRTFLRDCHDHALQANDLSQFYRDTATGLMNTFLAYEGHKTNEIFKVLTMISAVFIPLNFIAGIYGMNFDPKQSAWNMPELEWVYGYPFVLGLMGCVALFMLFYFRFKGWTAPPRRRRLNFFKEKV